MFVFTEFVFPVFLIQIGNLYLQYFQYRYLGYKYFDEHKVFQNSKLGFRYACNQCENKFLCPAALKDHIASKHQASRQCKSTQGFGFYVYFPLICAD